MSPKFNTPPNWPDTPEGWTPPPGWKPAPEWGEAPYGWKFWTDQEHQAGHTDKKRSWLHPLVSGVAAGALGLAVGYGVASADSSSTPVAETNSATAQDTPSAETNPAVSTPPADSTDPQVDDELPDPEDLVPGSWGMTMPAEDAVFGVKKPVENEGFIMTVERYTEKPTITINDSNYQPDSPYAEWRDVPPDKEGKFFVVEATVKNDTAAAVDLTCGLPVEIRMLDTDGRSYSPIENLYEVRGNPECNYQLEPGFESKMTYAFAAPQGATADTIVFAPSNLTSDEMTRPAVGIRVGNSE